MRSWALAYDVEYLLNYRLVQLIAIRLQKFEELANYWKIIECST